MAVTNDRAAVRDDGQSVALRVLREWLDEVKQPLREKLAELEGVEADLKAQLADVHDAQREVRRLLGDKPKPGPKPKQKQSLELSQKQVPSDELIADVRDYLERFGSKLGDDFSPSAVAEAYRENGEHAGVSRDRIKGAVLVLHDRGVIRATRRIKGGGTAYALTNAAGRSEVE